MTPRGILENAVHLVICLMIAAAVVLTVFNMWGPVTRYFKAMGG